MAKSDDIEILRSTQGPYVHMVFQKIDDKKLNAIKNKLDGILIIEIDGGSIRDETAARDVFNAALGISVGETPPNSSGLYWRRFEDLVQTDVDFQGHAGCVIFIKNAENCLRGSPDGVSYLANALDIAGQEYAKPQADEYYTPVKQPFHTVFFYNGRPRTSISATLIDLN